MLFLLEKKTQFAVAACEERCTTDGENALPPPETESRSRPARPERAEALGGSAAAAGSLGAGHDGGGAPIPGQPEPRGLSAEPRHQQVRKPIWDGGKSAKRDKNWPALPLPFAHRLQREGRGFRNSGLRKR